MAYIGNSPTNIVRGRRAVYEYTATAGQTVFTGVDNNGLSLDLLEANENDVYLNGSRLVLNDDYTVSGDTLTLLSAAALNDILIIVTQDEIANASSYTKAESDSRYINYNGDIVNGDLQVVGNVTLGSGSANGVAYLNGSNVLTSGSELTFDGSTLTITGGGLNLGPGGVNGYFAGNTWYGINTGDWNFQAGNVSQQFAWKNSSGGDWMRLTSTGLDVTGTITSDGLTVDGQIQSNVTGGGLYTSTAGGIPRLYVGGGSGFGFNRQSSGEDMFFGEPGDTGTWRVRGAGTISLGVGNTSTSMVVQGNGGNVGIGTNTPTFATIDTYTQRGLEILGNKESGTAPVIRLTETGSGKGSFEIRSNRQGSTSGNYLAFGEAADTFMVIRGDDDGGSTSTRGFVGIGTTSPTHANLVVRTDPIAAGTDNEKRGIKVELPFVTGYQTQLGSIISGYDGGIFGTNIGMRYKNGGYELSFGTNVTTSGSATERMVIDKNGYVTTPYQPSCLIACQSPDINWSAGNLIGYGTGGSIKVFDTTNSFDMGSYRYTAPITGKYYIACTANGVDTGTVPRAYIRINGTAVGNGIHLRGNSEGGGDLDQRTFAAVYHLNTGDYVDVYVFAGTFDTFGANYFSAHFLG